jgi:hypothetical protein
MDNLHIADALALKRSFPNDTKVGACYQRRICPLRHLGRTFKHPLTLLSVMAEWDCRLVGSEALRFFVPNSAVRKWDFYVPGYRESAADMISVLSHCGVTWDLDGDVISSALNAQKAVEVDARTLKAMSSWVRFLKPAVAAQLLGPTLYEAVSAFQLSHGKVQAKKYRIIPGPDLKLVPIKAIGSEEHLSLADDFHMMQGHIMVDGSVQQVRMIIGRFYSGIDSFVEFLHSFYNKRMHCFVGGWCASHLSYYGTITTRLRPPLEHQANGINSSQSFFLDYGDLYRTYIPRSHFPLLDMWLRKHREIIHTVCWFVVKDQLIMTHTSETDRRRVGLGYNGGLLAALNTWVPKLVGGTACPANESNFSEEWGLKSLMRCGGVFGPLPNGRQWSRIM